MRLTPSDPDIQTLILRIRSNEIDLQPDFQRGEIWSTTKKQRLIDSILRDWHIPPLHVIVDPETGQQLVLDGQQRLAAIRDFADGAIAVDGRIEPVTEELSSQHNVRYVALRPELKRRFDQFTIRVFRVTDYSPEEPGELFYRLNQPSALTAAEQRNAFFGDTRKQVKHLIRALEKAKLEDSFWGFSNARMAYDDILSRTALFLEQNSLKKKVTAGVLADRFRSGQAFAAESIQALEEVIGLCGIAKASMNYEPKFNKATAQSWLIFMCTAKHYLGNDFTSELINEFILQFENARLDAQVGLMDESNSKGKLHLNLLRAYEDRSTARVADALSVQTRDLVLWSQFLLSQSEAACGAQNRSSKIRELNNLLMAEQHENWPSVEKIVTSLNWGDPIWH